MLPLRLPSCPLQARLKFRDLVSLKALPYPSIKIQKRLRVPESTWGVRLRCGRQRRAGTQSASAAAALASFCVGARRLWVGNPLPANYPPPASPHHPLCMCSYECPLEAIGTFYRPPARLMLRYGGHSVQLTAAPHGVLCICANPAPILQNRKACAANTSACLQPPLRPPPQTAQHHEG